MCEGVSQGPLELFKLRTVHQQERKGRTTNLSIQCHYTSTFTQMQSSAELTVQWYDDDKGNLFCWNLIYVDLFWEKKTLRLNRVCKVPVEERRKHEFHRWHFKRRFCCSRMSSSPFKTRESSWKSLKTAHPCHALNRSARDGCGIGW